MHLTPDVIVDTILEILAAREASHHIVKTSPTAVCEALQKKGFTAMAGCWYRPKPISCVFDTVWDVACANFTCSIHGNARCIRF